MIIVTQSTGSPVTVRTPSASTSPDFAIAVLVPTDSSGTSIYLNPDDLRSALPTLARLLAEHDAREMEAELQADAERIMQRDAELDGEQTEPDYA